MHTYQGLSTSDIDSLKAQFGTNEIQETNKVSAWSRFAYQFKSILILLLIIAAIVSLLAGETIDAAFIFTIVMLNAFLGFYQEYQAEKAVAALRNMTISTVRAIRDGVELQLPSEELLPGDIVLLEEGSRVPADGEILESTSIEINESALTGESLGVSKRPRTEEQPATDEERVFLGTQVSRGHAVIRVTEIGMQTRFGVITKSLSQIVDDPTPLQKQLAALGKMLSILAGISCAVVFAIGFSRGYDLVNLFLTSVSLAVAAIPEGLPAIVTITLGLGVARMASRKAVMRKLSSIETLGSTQIICTDKTGTLTTNNMRVRSYIKVRPEIPDSDVMQAVSLCNTANLVAGPNGSQVVAGDTTEGALLYWVEDDQKGSYELFRDENPIILEFPFDSVAKFMTVFVKQNDNYIAYTKGAPEILIKHAELSDSARQQITADLEQLAEQGLRTMAVGRRVIIESEWEKDTIAAEHGLQNLELMALFGIADPPRAEAKQAIATAREAGVETMMITGDNPITARAIGKELGLLRDGEEVWTGDQLRSTPDDELMAKLERIRIFSRTTPEDKLRVITLLQRRGLIVASTGDGVNDALAIKKANIGIAMGITGTDVAKEASDMVLVDDNYSTIVSAIAEGRRIYSNIVNAVYYLLSSNLSEVIVIIVGILIFQENELPLVAVQVLWINLVTDGLPALALAMDPINPKDMKQSPRAKGAHIIQPKDYGLLAAIAICCAAATLFAFWYGLETGGIYVGRTYAFVTVVIAQCISILILRKTSPFSNPVLLGVLLLTILLQFAVVSIPFTQDIFELR